MCRSSLGIRLPSPLSASPDHRLCFLLKYKRKTPRLNYAAATHASPDYARAIIHHARAIRVVSVNGMYRLLGSFGYLAGFFACIFAPWPQNTVVTRLEGGGAVATTMSRYQHPERVAIVIAVLFPLLYEL